MIYKFILISNFMSWKNIYFIAKRFVTATDYTKGELPAFTEN